MLWALLSMQIRFRRSARLLLRRPRRTLQPPIELQLARRLLFCGLGLSFKHFSDGGGALVAARLSWQIFVLFLIGCSLRV